MLSFNLVAIGFSDLNHPVERSTFDEQLHRLIVKFTCTQIAAKNRLEAEHGSFCNRTTMIARIPFPVLASMLADRAQIFIAWMRLVLAITMLLNHRILAWRNHRLGSFGCNLVIAMAMVVCPIGRDLFYRLINGLQHIV